MTVAPSLLTLTLNPAVDLTWRIDATQDTPSFCEGKIHQVKHTQKSLGGKGINVARCFRQWQRAAQQKGHVVAAGIIGDDQAEWFETSLQQTGIVPAFLTVPYPTRQNLMLTSNMGHEMKFNGQGFPGLDYDRRAIEQVLFTHLNDVDLIVLTGSLPKNFPSTTYLDLIQSIRKKSNKSIIVDTSGESLREAIHSPFPPTLIKPNRQELSDALGKDLSDDKCLCDALLQLNQGIPLIILSDGANGAYFAHEQIIHHASAPQITPLDTTGAGDAMLACFCAQFFPDQTLTPAIMANSIAAGCAMAAKPGTAPSHPSQINDLSQQVKITQR